MKDEDKKLGETVPLTFEKGERGTTLLLEARHG